MSRTRRDIKYSNPNARTIRYRKDRVNQELYVQEMKEAGYQSSVRPRDKTRLQDQWDDHGVAGWAETHNSNIDLSA